MFLSGDRNIASDTTAAVSGVTGSYSVFGNTSAIAPGYVAGLGTNIGAAPLNGTSFGWNAKLHQNAGNVGLADGSVQQFSSSALKSALSHSGDTTAPTPNILLFP